MNLVGATPVLLSHITPGSMYYFEFSVLVNDTLLITERIEYVTESGGTGRNFLEIIVVHAHIMHTPTESFQLGAREGVIIAITSVFLGCFTVHTIIILCQLKLTGKYTLILSQRSVSYYRCMMIHAYRW